MVTAALAGAEAPLAATSGPEARAEAGMGGMVFASMGLMPGADATLETGATFTGERVGLLAAEAGADADLASAVADSPPLQAARETREIAASVAIRERALRMCAFLSCRSRRRSGDGEVVQVDACQSTGRHA